MNIDPKASDPPEPQGWFRWLHHHNMGRNQRFFQIQGLDSPINWETATRELLGVHAWEVGRNLCLNRLDECWETLTPVQRGLAAAGASENGEGLEWAAARLSSCELNAVTTCELGCNAVFRERRDLIATILDSSADLMGEVTRYDGPDRVSGRFMETVNQLSRRCIDLILEAAMIRQDREAIRLTLEHGANPNIPVWALERSFNEKHCALSFCIKGQMSEAVEMLLEAGADPGGIPFCTRNLPLFQAMATSQHSVAIRLLEKGASFADSDPGHHRRRTIARGRKKNSDFISPARDYFFGHFEEDLAWMRDSIESLIPLVPIEEKSCTYVGNGQGGQWKTFLDVAGNDVAVIRRYEALGLDSRLTAEEFLSMVEGNAYDKLIYLLSNVPESVKAKVIGCVRRRDPAFGSDGPSGAGCADRRPP